MSAVRVRVIPADGAAYDHEIDGDHMLRDLQTLVGGYIEVVRTEALRALGPIGRKGCVVMVVNEEGLLDDLPLNRAAWPFYPQPLGIRGDAVLIGEDEVIGPDGWPDRDFVSLPEGISA